MLQENIKKYQEFAEILFDNWLSGLIDDDKYFEIEHNWFMENGSNELFDYLINKYKGSRSEKKFENYKKEFNK